MKTVPNNVGVLGGGRMGAGIAHAFLISGANVSVVEVDESAAESARSRILTAVEKSIEKSVIGGSIDEWASHLTVASDDVAFAKCDLIIEAVPEIMDLKKQSLQRISEVAPEAVIATNTSSLSVSALAESTENEVIGLHFFNPVPTSKLVEIVKPSGVTDSLVEKARSWVEGLGKTPIVVCDSPGFASTRLGLVIALEAIRMVESGVASAEDIDAAMVLGYKFPIGPLALTDVVGLDVRLDIAEYLESQLGEAFAPPQLLREKVENGELGRKTGKGFYSYD